MASNELPRIRDPIETHQRLRRRIKLRGNLIHCAVCSHHVSIVDHLLSIHVVTATRQWDPQLLAHVDQVGIRDVINVLDLIVRHQSREDAIGDVEEAVVLNDDVVGDVVGDA